MSARPKGTEAFPYLILVLAAAFVFLLTLPSLHGTTISSRSKERAAGSRGTSAPTGIMPAQTARSATPPDDVSPALSAGAPVAQSSIQPQPGGEPAPAPTPLRNVPSTEEWRLAFADEFDGSALDETKWTPSFWWGNVKDKELQAYSAQNVELSNGLLRLRIDDRPLDGRPFAAGMISSHGKFSVASGYFEMRAKLPRGNGFWPAFWLALDRRSGITWPPEVDVMEAMGNDPMIAHLAVHFLAEDGSHGLRQSNYRGGDLSAGFHTFAVDLKPDVSVWYVDGQVAWRARTDAVKGPLYIVVNLAIGNWAGLPDASTPFPSYFEVDYLRVFQRVAN